MEFCAICGKPCIEDKIHYKVTDVNKNKAVKESLFCQKCGLRYVEEAFQPKQEKPIEPPSSVPVTLPKYQVVQSAEELLDLLFGKNILKKPVQKDSKPDCSKCGLPFQDFLDKGKLGCPTCYTHFDDVVFSMGEVFQNGGTSHVGKRPKNLVVEKPKDSLKTLKLKLASAVEQEKYEEAARFRDLIKNMEDEQAD